MSHRAEIKQHIQGSDEFIEKAVALVGEAWDDGNASGLDGWIGPGRGVEPFDVEAQHARTRTVHAAEKALNEISAPAKRAVDAVLELHNLVTSYVPCPHTACGCQDYSSCGWCGKSYPCPTVTAIQAAMGGGSDD